MNFGDVDYFIAVSDSLSNGMRKSDLCNLGRILAHTYLLVNSIMSRYRLLQLVIVT